MIERIGKNRIGRIIMVILLVMALTVGLIPSHVLAAEVADRDTSTKYTESLGDNVSTEYAGRIWTDKSVYSGDAVFEKYGGEEVTFELNKDGRDDEDFLIAYSALATSESVEGQTQAPVDVVLILDISGSMSNQDSNMDNGKSRIYNTVQAANAAIDELMALNPYTRVSVVAFSSNAQVLLPLDRYEKKVEIQREWIPTGRWSGYWQETEVALPYLSVSRETGSKDYATLDVDAVTADGNQISLSNIKVEGGTNIQMGLYEGMNVLATESSKTATINGAQVQRVPSVILLSDGSPTYSSNSSAWWAPADNYNDGPGSAPYAGNGMKAILVGSYMKDAIDRNYGVTGTAFATTVYTVGMGITDLSENEKNLAYMTLDPGTYWNDTSVTNSMKTTIKGYWDAYTKNNNTGTLNINVGTVSGNRYNDKNYYLTHPTTNYDVDPKTGYDYVKQYYKADDAAAVTNVFDTIVSNISVTAHQVPTELKGGNPIADGYITYTDPIGKYMEVKDVKAILYAGTEYTAKSVSTENDVTTYTFSGNVSSPVYGEQDISNIQITVEKAEDGSETLTIKIPAAVIPLRTNEVTLNGDGTVKSHTNNGAYPARVIYSVGLQDGVKKISDTGEMYIDTATLNAEYIAANTNEDGTVNFYSNLYTGENKVNGATAGDTTVEFEPSHTNPFYYILEDMPIYKDAEFKEQLTAAEGIDDESTYYYKDIYYHGNAVEEKAVSRTGAQLTKTAIKTGEDGYLYREAGSPRVNKMLQFEGQKVDNATKTAEDFYAPTFVHDEAYPDDPYQGKIVVYLGNNGVINVPAGGNLQISKSVYAGPGLTAPDKEFTFTLDINGEKVSDGAYKYVIVDAEGNQASEGTVSKTNPSLKLKDGQIATIYSLPPGTTYEVTETAVNGFATEAIGATGTIEAGKTNVAAFTNTYNVESVSFPTEGTLGGQKELVGRQWTADDEFTFFISPYNDAPLPENYDADTGVTVTAPDETGGQIASFDFGTIAFTAPGVYRYTIVEKEPENNAYLPGLAYSRALYRLVVEVADNGDGTLRVADYEIQKLYDDDATQLFYYDDNQVIVMNPGQEAQDTVKFINTYSAEAVTRVPTALKAYTDNSGEKPLVSGMFAFKLQALGYQIENGIFVDDSSKVPMPEGSVNGAYVTTNEGQNVTFPGVKFTQEMLGDAQQITYKYQMSEVVPADTDKVNGMKYDDSVYEIQVVVSIDPTSHVLNVNAIYPNNERTVTFHNEYTPVPVTADINGSKTLVGRDMKSGETFNFALEGANAATNNAVRNQVVVIPADTATVSGGKDGVATDFAFEDIKFTKAGTYIFAVTETAGSAASVEYDDSRVLVTVIVADADKDGNLEVASITYDNDKNAAEFENVYTTKFEGTPVSLEGTKNLTGKSLLEGEFFFDVVEYRDGKKIKEGLVSHTADTEADADGVYTGDIKFLDKKTYTEPGTYEYYITEQIPNPKVGGNIYDESKYRFTVVVEDVEQEGKLTVTSTNLEIKEGDSWKEVDLITFNNEYEPNPAAVKLPVLQKVIATNDDATSYPLEGGEFKFRISGEAEGMILPETKIVSNGADGTIQFGDMQFTKAGSYTVIIEEVIPETDKLPGMTYTDETIKINIVVTDNRTGQLTASVTGIEGSTTFVNQYEAEPSFVALNIGKNFTGRDNDEWLPSDKFEFEIVVADPETQEAIDAGYIEFPVDASNQVIDAKGEIATIDMKVYKAGTYKFMVHEKTGAIPGVHYDAIPRDITIVAIDDLETGKIETEVTIMKAGTKVDNLIFNNHYDAVSTELSGHDYLKIHKVFTGRDNDEWLTTDAFTFNLEVSDKDNDITKNAVDAGAVQLPDDTELVVNKENRAHAHFENIVFKEAGTYEFKVSEVTGMIPGVIYDKEPVYVKVVVENDQTAGALKIKEVTPVEIRFVNSYATTEVTLDGKTNLEVVKKLTGRDWFDTDAFVFTLSPADTKTEDGITAGNIIMPDDLSLTIDKSDDAGAATSERKGHFGDITFKVPGVYSFVIKETKGDIENLTYDEHETTVEVTVEDNKQGALVAIAKATYGSMTFENVYRPDAYMVPIGDDLNGKKILNGRTLADGEFTFVISKAADTPDFTPMPDVTTVTNKNGKITFGNIIFVEAGVYKYVIKEAVPEDADKLPGIVYDDGFVNVTVEVTYDPATGKLDAGVAYSKEAGKGGEGFTFINDYTSEKSDPVTLDLTKTVTETEGNTFTMVGDEFTFEIIPASTNPARDPVGQKTVTNSAEDVNGEAKAAIFDGVEFTEAGTYVYTIREADRLPAGFEKDPSVYTVKVDVTDDESKAKLQAAVTITKEGQIVDEMIFENGYDPAETTVTFSGQKTLISEHKNIEAGMFQFKLTAADGTPMPQAGEELVKNAETGYFQFGTITYDKPGTYEYVVSEVHLGETGYSYDETTYPITVVVEDVNGVLSATTTGFLDNEGNSVIAFENGYTPEPAKATIGGAKYLSVPTDSPRQLEEGEFTFNLVDEQGGLLGTVTNDETGAFVFEDIPFNKAGTYNYKIVEANSNIPGVTDDPKREIKVTIEVIDVDGQLQASVTYPDGNPEFTNTYAPLDTNAKITLSGIKVLEGKGNNGLEGGEFKFQLKDESGVVIDEASNDKDGAVIFDEIKYTTVGTHKYTVSEVKGNAERITYDESIYHITVTVKDGGAGYLVVDVQKDSEAIVFTNYYDAPEPNISIDKRQSVNDGNATKEKLFVKAGDIVTYYISVSNDENAGVASLVTITDKVPEGLEVVEICEPGINRDGVITWNIGNLAGGESKELWFKVKVPAVDVDTEWKNIAAVAYDDPNDPEDVTPKDPDLEEETPKPVIIVEDVEPKAPEKPEAPQNTPPNTGDHTNIMLWLMLLTASGTGLAGMTIYKRRNAEK